MEKFLMDTIYKDELKDALDKAFELGVITEQTKSYYWAYQKEGMRWLNEFPDWVEPSDEDVYTEREENHKSED